MVFIKNKPYIHNKEIIDNIYLVQQFYIHRDIRRFNEILFCLRKNCNNKFIDKIYLLNEKIYTQKELGLNDEQIKKIVQVDIKKRMKYSDFFNFINHKKEKDNLEGYVVLANSDIYLNETVTNLYRTNLSFKKACFMQLRLDTIRKHLKRRNDSQDTWIFHSNTIPSLKFSHLFNFNLGVPGCDNKIVYQFYKLNYTIYNEPYRIETIHIHKSMIRTYKITDRVKAPYGYLAIDFLKINNTKSNLINYQKKQKKQKNQKNQKNKIIYKNKKDKQNDKDKTIIPLKKNNSIKNNNETIISI